MSSVDWGETKAILLEVEQLFNRDDDVRDIEDIKKMQREVDNHQQNSLKDAKEIIKEMTKLIAEKELEVMAPTETLHSTKLESYVLSKEKASQQVELLREALDNKRENISKMGMTALSLKHRADEFALSTAQADTRTTYALSLYTKISNITWDYSNPEDCLGGCIGNERTKELHSFKIELKDVNDFDLANNLWDMIGDGIAC